MEVGPETEQCDRSDVEDSNCIDRILRKDPKNRTENDIELLAKNFATNNFFQEKKKILDSKTINYLYRNLRLVEYEGKETVFNYGDKGDFYYILLTGEVVVKTPSPFVLQDSQFTPIALLTFLINFFEDVMWKTVHNGDYIRDLLIDAFQKVGYDVKQNEKIPAEKVLEALRKEIQNNRTGLHELIFKKATQRQHSSIKQLEIYCIQEVTKLGPGIGFGELALLRQEGRKATIQCTEASSFATLSRQDFANTIQKAEYFTQ